MNWEQYRFKHDNRRKLALYERRLRWFGEYLRKFARDVPHNRYNRHTLTRCDVSWCTCFPDRVAHFKQAIQEVVERTTYPTVYIPAILYVDVRLCTPHATSIETEHGLQEVPEGRLDAGRGCFGIVVTRELVFFDQNGLLAERISPSARWSATARICRHLFASNLAASGVDQRIIDDWMGHTTEEMRRRYRHLFPDQQRQAIELVFGTAHRTNDSEARRFHKAGSSGLEN